MLVVWRNNSCLLPTTSASPGTFDAMIGLAYAIPSTAAKPKPSQCDDITPKSAILHSCAISSRIPKNEFAQIHLLPQLIGDRLLHVSHIRQIVHECCLVAILERELSSLDSLRRETCNL